MSQPRDRGHRPDSHSNVVAPYPLHKFEGDKHVRVRVELGSPSSAQLLTCKSGRDNRKKQMQDVAEVIRRFNESRDPERLTLKYQKMRANPYVFLRGTCHLFYDQLAVSALPSNAPTGWICGDLHLENFGSYKGNNRLTYFDINDFDEAILAPVTWDLVRFLTSVFAAKETLDVGRGKVITLCETFLASYVAALGSSKPYWVERDTAHGLIHTLLDDLGSRNRSDHLDKFTDVVKKRRVIRCDGERALPVDAKTHKAVEKLVRSYAAKQDDKGFFEVLDVARRIAGVGSLGVERYVVLVEGKGSSDRNYLLDIKASTASALSPHVQAQQPQWDSEAKRVVALQTRMQAVPMAFLAAIDESRRSYVLRGLQPSEDRVVLDGNKVKFADVREVVAQMGQIVAWSQLRSSGQQGAASADALVAFSANSKGWRNALITAAEGCAAQNLAAWNAYAAEYDAGGFAI